MSILDDWLPGYDKPAPKPTPLLRKPKTAPSERDIQREIVKALRKLGMLVAAVPNGAHLAGDGDARMRQMSAMVADGLLPGFPDILIINRTGKLGLIEVKRPGGKLSAAQVNIGKMVEQRGVPWAVVYSLDDALRALKLWGWM